MVHLHAGAELALGAGLLQRILDRRQVYRRAGGGTIGAQCRRNPNISGRTWVTGTARYTLGPEEPVPASFLL